MTETGERTDERHEDATKTPVICPICGTDFERVSTHDEGLLVNLDGDEQFRRVCVQPLNDETGTALVRLFQHGHEDSSGGQPGTPGGRIP